MPGKRSFGSIRRLSSGRYQARYTGPALQTHNAPETFTAKIDAEAWLAAERHLSEDPASWLAPNVRLEQEYDRRARLRRFTFGPYSEDWLAHRDLAASTRNTYAQLLKHHLLPTFADVPLSEIDRALVATWYRRVGPGTPHARKHAYDLLRNILNMALDDELIDRNPVHIRGASNVKRTGTTQPASIDELEALAEATPERYRLMVLVAAWCALRKGELSELRRSDVDTTQWVLRVRRGVGFVPGRTVVKDPKTQAGKRDVAIPEHLVPMVREHLLRHAQQGAQGLMFPSSRGEHLRTSAIGRWYYPAREAAGRPDLRFHDLRHTGAVLAAQSGATLAELMHRLGHSTPAAAMRYQHAAAERDREIAQRMSQRYREHVQARPSDCTLPRPAAPR